MSEAVRRLRRAARMIVYGRNSNVSDDEFVGDTIKTFVPVPDATATAPRLNIIVPDVSAKAAFGGLATVIDLAVEVVAKHLATDGWRLRVISHAAPPEEDDNIVDKYAGRHGLSGDATSFVYGVAGGAAVPVGPGDLFLGSLWHSLYAALPLLKFQQEQFGGPTKRYVSLVQDYEAAFHPWSSAFVLARSTYDGVWPKNLIFNSTELRDFYIGQGHPVDTSVAFDPVMNASLLDQLQQGTPDKERRILFYGRPGTRRNCFYLTRKALQIWSETYDKAGDWTLVSAGESYRPFALSGGAQLTVHGKLTLDEYASELKRAAVGLSLMASPHPSYPPLEMAHFGALTVTNAFTAKDLSTWHDNLTSVEVPDPESIAAALVANCEAFEADPQRGLNGHSRKPHYLEPRSPAVMDEIAALLKDAAGS